MPAKFKEPVHTESEQATAETVAAEGLQTVGEA
jgi:hypothetical protein